METPCGSVTKGERQIVTEKLLIFFPKKTIKSVLCHVANSWAIQSLFSTVENTVIAKLAHPATSTLTFKNTRFLAIFHKKIADSKL